jgi:hypothetical protein
MAKKMALTTGRRVSTAGIGLRIILLTSAK